MQENVKYQLIPSMDTLFITICTSLGLKRSGRILIVYKKVALSAFIEIVIVNNLGSLNNRKITCFRFLTKHKTSGFE